MWDKSINKFIIDYYMQYYAANERQMYLPDLPNLPSIDDCVIGGELGLKYILGDTILPTDQCIIFARDMVNTAREISHLFYNTYEIALTMVKTSVPYKEINVQVAGRMITSVYPISTTMSSAVNKSVKYWNGAHRKLVSIDLKVVSPRLYMIEYLSYFIDPLMINKRDSIHDTLCRLSQLVDLPDARIIPIGDSVLRIFNNKHIGRLRDYIADRLIVHIIPYNNKIYLITDQSIEDELAILTALGANNVREHNIQMPGALYFPKITANFGTDKTDMARVTIYNIASYRIVPYRTVTAMSDTKRSYKHKGRHGGDIIRIGGDGDDDGDSDNSDNDAVAVATIASEGVYGGASGGILRECTNMWKLYILMIEDNSGLDLLYNKQFTNYQQMASRDLLSTPFEEFNSELMYGKYIDPSIIKKKIIANSERMYPYYPILHLQDNKKATSTADEPVDDKSIDKSPTPNT